jgi:light-regulated signal transduction histidine kinase (bacteriophytochrome)
MYLERVRAGSQRMARLIEELLGLAKVSRHVVQRQRVDFTARAREGLQRLQMLDPTRRVETQVQPDLTAYADPVLVGVVLDNLLDNAWKFSGRRTPARIEVGRAQTTHGPAFFVRDNGVGFDMDHADKLFGAFQRLHSSRDYDGTGIGLATTHRVIERHGGRIWADARPDQGATFYFTLEGETHE